MKIPVDFKVAINNAFYDKEVVHYVEDSVTDGEGFTRAAALTELDTFMANVRRLDMESRQERERFQRKYGLEEKVDIVISTHYTAVESGNIIGYGEDKYLIVAVDPRDSHYLLVGRKWLLQSQIPSA